MNEVTAKACRSCGVTKSLTEFGPRGEKWRSYCYQCERDRLKRIYHQNPVAGRERQREWIKANPRKNKDTKLRSRLGIGLDDYEAMIAAQKNRCATCGDEGRLEIDHCHASGRIRKLLCGPCNRALGQAKDDPKRLRALAAYVEEFQCV